MQQPDPKIDTRLRTMRTLWFALFLSVGLYLGFTVFAMEPASEPGNRLLSFIFAAVATFIVILSFPIRQKLLQRSVDQQNTMLVQQAFVVAWAMCEVSAILGIVEYMVVGSRDYLVLFLLAAVGMLLHFPKRQHLLDASYKKQDW